MTYPQPQASEYVLNGQSAFRLTTRVVGPGDVYESDASGLAMALGPLSDIANVGVTYFDERRVPSMANQIVVGPERSYVGRLDARMDTVYPLSLRPGRVLFTLEDLYDPNFRPTGFTEGDDAISFLDPVLDILLYFESAPSIVPARSDKQLYTRYLDVPAANVGWLMVPYWGRKYAHISFRNDNATDTVTFSVIGVRFSMTENPDDHYQETLLASAAYLPGASVDLVVRAGNQGVFDMLGFSQTIAGPCDLRITLSDKAL